MRSPRELVADSRFEASYVFVGREHGSEVRLRWTGDQERLKVLCK